MDQRITYLLSWLERADSHNLFLVERNVISNTKYRVKFRVDFYPKSCTTWGVDVVHLAHDFFTWPIEAQAHVLIHETVHQEQWRRGAIKFLTQYLAAHFSNGYEKNPFEQEAERRARQFSKLILGRF